MGALVAPLTLLLWLLVREDTPKITIKRWRELWLYLSWYIGRFGDPAKTVTLGTYYIGICSLWGSYRRMAGIIYRRYSPTNRLSYHQHYQLTHRERAINKLFMAIWVNYEGEIGHETQSQRISILDLYSHFGAYQSPCVRVPHGLWKRKRTDRWQCDTLGIPQSRYRR